MAFNLDTMLINLSGAFDDIKMLIIAVSYVTGVFFFMTGLIKYRIFANQTFGSAQRGEMIGPLVYIMIGAILIYFPSTLSSSLTTVFGSANISSPNELMAYSSLSAVEKWRDIADVILQYVYLVGLIAFVRGWVILAKVSHSQGQGASIGKGLIHIIGGILLVNIVDTVNILAQTFGYTA